LHLPSPGDAARSG